MNDDFVFHWIYGVYSGQEIFCLLGYFYNKKVVTNELMSNYNYLVAMEKSHPNHLGLGPF